HDVHRWMRPLERFGDHPDLGNREVATLEREALQGPRFEHDREAFLETLAILDLGHAIALELDGPVAATDTDVEPSFAQDIDDRELFGESNRIVEWKDRGGQADAHPPRPRRGRRRQDGRRDRQAVVDEMVLRQPDAVEAELLGPHHLLDLTPDDLRVGDRGRGLQEVVRSEAHRAPDATSSSSG